MTPILLLGVGLIAPILPGDSTVTRIGVVPSGERTEVVISVEGEPRYFDFTMEGPDRIVLDIMGGQHTLPREDYPGIDRGGVRAVLVEQSSDQVVRIVIELEEGLGYEVVRGDGELTVSLPNAKGPFAPWSTADFVPDPARTEDRRITVTFSGTPLREVLFHFAEYANRSIVPGAGVTGTVDATIRNQPWKVALRSILDAHRLVAEEDEHGIIRVEASPEPTAQDSVDPVETRSFRISYTTADEMREAIAPLLSEGRGKISVETGTNTLIVTDFPRVVKELGALIEEIDTPTRQVSISAKIVFVNRTDLNEFGVTYDLKEAGADPFAAGSDAISLAGTSIAALGNAQMRVAGPSLVLLSSLVLGRYTLTNFVEALSSASLSDVQAAPALQVMDNRTADIIVGERTPIRVVEAGTGGAGDGSFPRATVDYQETGVILQVTPTITSDDRILLDMRAERSAAELAESDVGFIFRKQAASTQVLVRDGETAVIAGLTVTEANEVRSGIPLLMDIPLLGRLFRVTRKSRVQRDLMILVTPRIVRDGVP